MSLVIVLVLVFPIASNIAVSTIEPNTSVKPYIVRPFYGLPVVLEPGSNLEILIKTDQEVPITGAKIYYLNTSYELSIEKIYGITPFRPDKNLEYNVQRIIVKLPDNVKPGLYTLEVTTKDSSLYMPRSIIVREDQDDINHVRVLHITDQHLGASNKGIPNTYKNTRYIALANTLALQYNVELVAVTGDQVDIGGDLISNKNYYAQMNQILIPTIIVPGNHDWAQVSSLKSFLVSLYGRYQNTQRYWSFVYENFIFIGIDTRGEGYPEDYQLDFIEEVLKNNMDKKAIIMFHHPIFNQAGFYQGTPEELRSSLYYSWRGNGWEQAKRFIDIIYKYENIIAVLSGHVHRDADAVLVRPDGSKVYFITTTTANHGYPEGYYWGAKIVDIYTNGSVKVVLPSGRPYFFKSGSLNTESFMVIEHVDANMNAVTWTFNTTGFNEMSVDNLVLVFFLNKSIDTGEYRIYGDREKINKLEYYEYGPYHLYLAWVNATSPGKITISSYEDNEPPIIKIITISPKKPKLGKVVSVVIAVKDEGWGVYRVEGLLETPNGDTVKVKAVNTGFGDRYIIVFTPETPGTYRLKVIAIDLNNNYKESNSIEFNVKGGRKTTTTEKPTLTTTTTTTEETARTQTTTAYKEKYTKTQTQTTTTTTYEHITTTPSTTGLITSESKPETTITQVEETTAIGKGEAQTGEVTTKVEEQKVPLWVMVMITLIIVGLAGFVLLSRR